MRARRGLIPTSFLVLLLPLILVSCSGGGNEAPQSLTAPTTDTTPPPPVQAGLIWSTSTGIFRSQTDGTGRLTIADDPDLITVFPHVSHTSVVYQTRPPQPWDLEHNSAINKIWKADVQGGGSTLLVVTDVVIEYIMDVFDNWVIYGADYRATMRHSIALDGSSIHQLGLLAFYERQVGGRAVMMQEDEGGIASTLFSELPDGTDLRVLTVLPLDVRPTTQPIFVGVSGSVGNQVLYSLLSVERTPDLFAVPVTGGPVTTLTHGPDYKAVEAVVGSRVVYARCAIVGTDPFGNPTAGPCDLFSVLSDGTGTVALSTNPDNEIVQGVIGSQVIVRRNSGATDSLYSIPASGGAEVPMLTLADPMHEFVKGLVGNRVIVTRPTGLWSLHADGSGFVQLTTEADEFTGSAGAFACFGRGPALWCVPADGSAPATRVTENGTFVVGL